MTGLVFFHLQCTPSFPSACLSLGEKKNIYPVGLKDLIKVNSLGECLKYSGYQ